jgi:hypothetical protein
MRRIPPGRPPLAAASTTAWPASRPAFADANTPIETSLETSLPATQPQLHRAARRLLIATIIMTGMSFGSVLGLVGWPMLQAAGLVAAPAIETIQRQQSATLSALEASMNAVHATVAGMGARVDHAVARRDAVDRRMAEIDSRLGTLQAGVDEVRATQSTLKESTAKESTVKEAWREPVAELAAAAAKTRSEVARLRSSLDEASRARPPDGLAGRVERIEQALIQRNLLGPMRGAIQEPAEAARSGTDGHIINLAPAR